MEPHPYGWLSIAPPLATVIVALVTRRVLLSLLLGLAAGALVMRGGNVVMAAYDLFEVHLWTTFIDPFKLRVLGFTLLMGAVIGVLNAGGGMKSLVLLIEPAIHTARRGQIITWLLGLAVFFDDYTNTLLLGNTMRSTFDRLKLSREKLAYIVDSTAAPVACLAPLSVWVAVELEWIREGLVNADPRHSAGLTPMGLFIGCLPYRFYIIQALLLVLLVAIMRRDIGPMVRAERRARAGSDGLQTIAMVDTPDAPPSHWSNAVTPIALTLVVVLSLIVVNGRGNLATTDVRNPTLGQVFGAADASMALFYGALVGLCTAMAMLAWRRVLDAPRLRDAAFTGARAVIPALAILWLAGGMSRMTGSLDVDGASGTKAYQFKDYRLYTGDYLKALLPSAESGAGEATAAVLPTIVFLLSCLVAFSTGTSFGAMGIVLPFVVPLALATVAGSDAPLATHPLLLASIGSVMAGAIFGDHCSPISDTTILSSQASGCDHIAHVVTQMPYAVAAAVVSTLGILMVGFGASVWFVLPAQTAALAGLLLVFGQRVEDQPHLDPADSHAA